jgi:hypothetical protein
MDQEDSELITMLADWCVEIVGSKKTGGLHEDLYHIPEVEEPTQMDVEKPCVPKRQYKEQRSKWGPTLVDKRPSRTKKDGRTMMKIAQERKKITNLERGKGIPKQTNSFSVLSSLDIVDMASCVGVSIGLNDVAKEKAISDIVKEDSDRAKAFSETCKSCQEDMPNGNDGRLEDGGSGDGAPTPVGQGITTQGGDDEYDAGQWTYVAHKKKSKTKVNK